MHVFAIVVVWFYLIVAGIILTMLMPRIASESRSCEVVRDTCERTSSHQMVRKPAGSMVQMVSEA
jgi:hypothetical protein